MRYAIIFILLLGTGCGREEVEPDAAVGRSAVHEPGTGHADATGPHGGRLLGDRDFQVELTIFESGVDPQFRAYAYAEGDLIPPEEVSLAVELTRLGGQVDRYTFAPRAGYLLGDGVVKEPHSFSVSVVAGRGGVTRRWTYDSFEGRTRIGAATAAESGIVTEIAGPALLRERLELHGTIVPDPQRVFRLHARFPGVIRDVRKRIGDSVASGETVAVIEANESLQSYAVIAPAAGVVVSRMFNPGMSIDAQPLLTIADLNSVWVELAAFQHDLSRILPGQPVIIRDVDGHQSGTGTVDGISPIGASASQSMTVRVVLKNEGGRWHPGLFVTGEVTVAEYEVPLAVRREALQSFRDWTVLYENVGDEYEVRPVETGRADDQRVEILDGINTGTKYVAVGSYLLKADIEKSGASHDH